MKAGDWISVKDKLPEVDTMVLVCTINDKCGISSMYIPKDCYGNVLGDKEWRGCGAMYGIKCDRCRDSIYKYTLEL